MFTVYRITNLINLKYYIGVHKTDDPMDSYMGSGEIIRKAIAKYGIDSFKKEILFIFDNEEDAYNKEKELLEDKWQLQECYNMMPGGTGSWSYVNSLNLPNIMQDPEFVKAHVELKRKNNSYYTEKNLSASRKNAKLGAEARRGMKDSVEVKKKRSESVKKALADPEIYANFITGCRKKCIPYIIIDPNGVKYETNVVSELCKELDIPISTVTTHSDGRPIKRGRLKGWTILKLNESSN